MILVDSSAALHRILYMNKDAVIQNPEFLSHLLLTQFNFIASNFGASKVNPVVLCLDSSSWRKDYYNNNKPKTEDYKNETYKGNRTKDSDFDWTEVYKIYDGVCEALKQHSDYFVMKVEKAEADDIIAILTKHYKSKETVYVISSDKDFAQLQDQNVLLYDPLKKSFKPDIDVESWKKIHIIIGDDVDNIKAIKPRVKEKTAQKMLKDLDTLLQTNPDMKEKYLFNENLISFEKIPLNIEDAIIEEFTNQKFSFNQMNLMKEFIRYKLVKHTENILKFKLQKDHIKTKLNSYHEGTKKVVDIVSSSLEEFFGE